MSAALRHLSMGLVWQMPVPVACSLAVEGGGIAVTCGQCPLDRDGRVLDPGQAAAQAGHAVRFALAARDHLERAREAACVVLYHTAATSDHTAATPDEVVQPFVRAFPAAAILPVRLPHFYLPGMMVEADVFLAEAPPAVGRIVRDGASVQIAEGPDLIFVALTAPDAESARAALIAAAVDPVCLLAAHWFATEAPPPEWDPHPAARVMPPVGDPMMAVLILAPGPVIAGRTPGGAVMRSADRFAWISAVAEGDLGAAAGRAMDALALPGLPDLAPIKATTHYVGNASLADLNANLTVRHARFPLPGPASTGVPVAGLAGARIAIDMLMLRTA